MIKLKGVTGVPGHSGVRGDMSDMDEKVGRSDKNYRSLDWYW